MANVRSTVKQSISASETKELKVIVNGVERCVMGLNEGTTCQEVIYALAHATSLTGRFVLIEKWRNAERSLAPTDKPLVLLERWKEHADQVKFILKHLDTEESTSKSYNSLPRPPVRKPVQRPQSSMAQPINRIPVLPNDSKQARVPPPSYEEALRRKHMLLCQKHSQMCTPTSTSVDTPMSIDEQHLYQTVAETEKSIHQQEETLQKLQAEESDLHATRARHVQILDNIQKEIDRYEAHKAQLRTQIEMERSETEKLQNEITCQEDETVLIDLKSKIADIDQQLELRNYEIESLNQQINTLSNDENMNDVQESVDQEIKRIDEQLSSRQAQLQDLTLEAQRLGIKMKPGVWV